jgi:hypothetical protein
MSDEIRAARQPVALRQIKSHVCDHSSGCKEIAPFGINTRYGTLWFCSTAHAEEAEKDRVPGFGK